ncbi:DsbA family oxidoreductase [Arsenicitalea aurantiaca]|nr:DsbA family oxidoreductase [Arsenicitalea aurantiaca]
MTRTLKIDLFTDVSCPWCLIGTARLDAAIERLPDDVTVEIARHPFQLAPDTPKGGVVVADMLREKYGRDPEPMWAQVEAAAADAGVPLRMAVQPMAYDTAAAHTLVRLAPIERQHRLGNAIANAYFLEGRNTSDPDVLAEIAGSEGLDPETSRATVLDPEALEDTRRMARDAAAHGINGVPYFILNGALAFSGAQPDAIFDQAIEMALDPEKLKAARG